MTAMSMPTEYLPVELVISTVPATAGNEQAIAMASAMPAPVGRPTAPSARPRRKPRGPSGGLRQRKSSGLV